VKFTEYIKLAWRSIMSNKLRTFLTMFIISLGIGALVGIITSINALENSMRGNFATMGTNTFSIVNQGTVFDGRPDEKVNKKIDIKQAELFKENYKFPAKISTHVRVSGNAVCKYENKKTNPNVSVRAIDDDYLTIAGLTLADGRNFTKMEIDNGVSVCIIGEEIINKLYKDRKKIIGSLLTIGSAKYRVVGTIKSKGQSMGGSDNIALVGYNAARQNYDMKDVSYEISVYVNKAEDMNRAIDEAMGLFRKLRKLGFGSKEDFEIQKSDSNAEKLISILSSIKLATIFIGVLTLIGAGIGLMNIMLVSVNERTREIGLNKAIGAKGSDIMMQFLSESILICILGGICGIILGIILGSVVALFLNTAIVIPWNWVLIGLTSSFVIGLLAGIYPAIKALKLNPVEALRYE
jgi:putative ABC transport system permease protein